MSENGNADSIFSGRREDCLRSLHMVKVTPDITGTGETNSVLTRRNCAFRSEQAQIEKHFNKNVLGNAVFNHNKAPVGLQTLPARGGVFSAQFIEGKGTGRCAKDSFAIREMGGVNLDQEDIVISSCFLPGNRKHACRKIDSYCRPVVICPFT